MLTFEVAGRPPVPPSQQPAMQVRIATPEYFETIGIPLKRGRLFSDDDRWGRRRSGDHRGCGAAVLPGRGSDRQDASRLAGAGPGQAKAGGEVVGIIGDIKDEGLAEPDPPQIYLPYRQWPVGSMAW